MSSAEASETPSVPDIPGGPRVPLTARPRTMLGLLLFATALVFLPALGGEFVWDDTQLIGANPYIRDLSRLGEALTHDFWHNPQSLDHGAGLPRRYYRPVVTLAYALQFRAFGERPVGYHLVNLALHLSCVVLVFGWLRRRLATAHGTDRSLAVILGAAVFAVHPSRPESVAWISGSTDLWLALFALLGLRAWDRGPGYLGAARAGMFFFLAALSKETAVVLPALLLVDLVLLPRHEGPHRETLQGDATLGRALGRWALASAGVGLALGLRFAVVRQLNPPNTHEAWSQTPVRVLASFGHYLVETFAPWWPAVQGSLRVFVRNRPVYAPWSVALGAVGFVALGALALWAWRRPRGRPWLADALWFVLALGPTLNVVPMGMTILVASRFLYLPLLGVCALAARAAFTLPGRPGVGLRAALGGLALAFGVVCSQHAAHFTDRQTLWTAELQRNPFNYYALSELATDALERGDHGRVGPLLNRGYNAAVRYGVGDEAVRFMVKSAQFLLWTTPDDDQETLREVRGFLDAFVTAEGGTARLRTRQFRIEAPLPRHERRLRQSLHLEPFRAWAYFRTGETAAAEAQLREAARRPHAYGARRYLAMVLMAQQRWDEARTQLDALLRAMPTDVESARLRSWCESYPRALDAARDAVARTSLEARLWTDLSRPQKARELLAPVLRAHPDRIEPLAARLYAEMADRRPEAAEIVVREATLRAPSQAAAFQEALQRARRGRM